jgi:hypothetical protein
MAKFSPTEAVFAGFRFAKERPAAILIWSAYVLVIMAVTLFAMFDIAGDSLPSLMIASQGSHPNPQQLMKLTEQVLPATLFGFLLMLVFGSVLFTAMLRVRLKPGPHPWGGFQLGGEELRMLGATAIVVGMLMLLEIAVGTAADLLATVGVPQVVALIPGLALVVAMQVRLSLVGAVSQIEGRISLPRSVQLTRKGFWRLLGAYVLLLAIALVILVVVTILFAALMGAAVTAQGGGIAQVALALQHNFADLNPVVAALYIASNLVQVWLVVVVIAVLLSIAVDAYKAFASETPRTDT